MKLADRKILERLEAIDKRIQDAHVVDLNETLKEKEARKKKLLRNYKAFTGYYFPEFTMVNDINTTAWFHKKAADHVYANPDSRLNFQLSRGFAKSTTFCVFLPIWLMLRNRLKFMVLVSQSQEKAERLLGDLRKQLQINERLIHDYGKFFKNDIVSSNNFITSKGVYFTALGRGGNPRGLRYGANRPDYIVMDDISDPTIVNSKVRMKKLWGWVKEDLMGTTSMGSGCILVAENKYHENCITSLAEQNEAFHTIRVDALNDKEQSNWPEHLPTEKILKQKQLIGSLSFMREYMNTPVTEGAVFQPEWLRYTDPLNLEEYAQIISYTDPSWTSNKHSDYKSVCVVGITHSGDFHILELYNRKTSVKSMLSYIFDIWSKKYTDYASYFIEANFMQDTLVQAEIEKHPNFGDIPLRMDYRKKANKNQRIENMSPYFENGRVYINNEIKSNEDTKIFKEQLFSFDTNSGCPGHDDSIDSLQGAISLLLENNYSAEAINLGGERDDYMY